MLTGPVVLIVDYFTIVSISYNIIAHVYENTLEVHRNDNICTFCAVKHFKFMLNFCDDVLSVLLLQQDKRFRTRGKTCLSDHRRRRQ